MKSIILLLFAMVTLSAKSQLTLLPQVGIDHSKTIIQSNDFSSFAPLGMKISPMFGARLGYIAKSGHGAYLGVSTSAGSLNYRFTDPLTAGTSYKVSGDELGLHLEAGYQFSTKPIALSKHGTNKTSYRNSGTQHHGCGGHTACGQHNGCSHHTGGGEHFTCSQHRSINRTGKSSSTYMRIKPSVGLAFAPSEDNRIESETKNGLTSYEYKAGWKTAITAGIAFDFGSQNQSKFVVSVNYLHGLGNNTQTLNTVDNSKTTAHTFQSGTSGFSVSLGIPINLSTKKHSAQPHGHCGSPSPCMSHCGHYRMFLQQ